MKKFFFLLLMVAFVNTFAQSDTLFTSKHTKIACKIYEINEFEVKYRLAENLEGPVFVIDKAGITKYTLSNGYTEVLMPDELSLENEHKEIIGNREVVKFQPFGLAFDHITFAYEKVMKVGMNLDVEVSYINSQINPSVNTFGYVDQITYSGAYIKPGMKFFLGQDFSVKGLRYAHPLKGRYIKLDLAASFVNYQGLTRIIYTGGAYGTATTTSTITSALNTAAYGGFVNYGRQFILGNILTMDYYVGIGFTGQSYEYSNPQFNQRQYNGYYYSYYEIGNFYNYHGFLRIPNFGMSFTAGFRIGYIIPSKKPLNQVK